MGYHVNMSDPSNNPAIIPNMVDVIRLSRPTPRGSPIAGEPTAYPAAPRREYPRD